MRCSITVLVSFGVCWLSLAVGTADGQDKHTQNSTRSRTNDDAKPVPHLNDETPWVEIEAHYEKYIDKTVIICGIVKMDSILADDPHSRYTRDTYYCLSFVEVGKDTKTHGDTIGDIKRLYLRKGDGDAIADDITKFQAEQQKLRKPRWKLMRVRIMPVREDTTPHFSDGTAMTRPLHRDVVEVLDAQPCKQDANGWEPWIVEAATAKIRSEQAAAKAVEEKAKAERVKAETDRKADAEKAKWRAWTDASGEHKIEAKYGGMIAGKVKLIKQDGTAIRIPVETLSDEDQEWIKNRK